MKPSKYKIFISVKSYDEKTAENNRNCYDAGKHIASKLLSKISIPDFDSTNSRLNENCIKSSSPYLLCFPRNKPSNSVTVAQGWFGPVFRFKCLG